MPRLTSLGGYHGVNAAIERFASAMMSDGQSAAYYARERAASKPRDDIMVGKKGEFIARQAIEDLFISVGWPDMRILSGGEKNWESDLTSGLGPVHVKTCSDRTIAIAGEPSWTFNIGNSSGAGGLDCVLCEGSRGVSVFVHVPSWDSMFGTVHAIASIAKIKPIMRDQKLAKLRGLKKCVYASDIKSYLWL